MPLTLNQHIPAKSPHRWVIYSLFGLWNLFLFYRFYSILENPYPVIKNWVSYQRFPDLPLVEKIHQWLFFGETLFLSLWTFLLAWRMGRKFRLFISARIPSPSMALFIDFALGVSILNTAWMGFGLVGLWFPGFWALLTLFLSLWVAWDLRSSFKSNRGFSITLLQWNPAFIVAFLIVLAYLVILVGHSLLPETFYDSLNYFLGMPQAWINRHGICDLPTQMLSGYFHGGSLFFMNGLIGGGAEAAKTLNALVLVLCVGIVAFWMREWAEDEVAFFAAFWTLTFPLLFINSLAARVDGLVTLITLLVFYCLSHVMSRDSGETGMENFWVLTACCLSGAALGVKPTALVALAAQGILLLGYRGPRWFFQPRHWAYALAGFLIFTAPWLLKNWAYTANPLFPYASSFFGGRALTNAHSAQLLGENHQFLPMDQGLLSYVTLPWRLTMPHDQTTQFLGPLILAFLPIAVFSVKTHDRWKYLSRLTWVYLVLGLCSTHMLRFLMPGFLLLFMLVGKTVAGLGSGMKKIAWATLCLSAFLNLGPLILICARTFDGVGIWSGRETRDQYLDRMTQNSYLPLARWCENLPSKARVLLVGDARGLYYPRPFLANSAFDTPFFEEAARSEKDASGILRQLKEKGVDVVVMNLPEGIRLSQEYGFYQLRATEWTKLDQFFRQGLDPVYIRPNLQAYLVREDLNTHLPFAPYDPFTFFDPKAIEFSQALNLGNLLKAESLRKDIIERFPGNTYWLGQIARLDLEKAKRAKKSTLENQL